MSATRTFSFIPRFVRRFGSLPMTMRAVALVTQSSIAVSAQEPDNSDGVVAIRDVGIPNFVDTDDDSDGDGTADYLDVDDDGHSINTSFEDPDINGDCNPSDALTTASIGFAVNPDHINSGSKFMTHAQDWLFSVDGGGAR